MIRLKAVFALVNHTAVMLELIGHFLPVFASLLGALSWSQMKKSPTWSDCNSAKRGVFTTTQHNCNFLLLRMSDSHQVIVQFKDRKLRVQVHLKVLDLQVLVCRSACWHIALAALFTHDRISSQVAEWINWSVRRVRERLNLDHKWYSLAERGFIRTRIRNKRWNADYWL